MKSNIVVFALAFFLIVVAIPSCNYDLVDVYSPKELRDVLRKSGGWVPLVIPDSKYRPGSIITINAVDNCVFR